MVFYIRHCRAAEDVLTALHGQGGIVPSSPSMTTRLAQGREPCWPVRHVMNATRACRGAVPLNSETEITARRCRARVVTARAQDRSRGSARAYVDNELPCGARYRRREPDWRLPGCSTGAVRQRIT